MKTVHGKGASDGIAAGRLAVLGGRRDQAARTGARDAGEEWERFLRARREAAGELEMLRERALREAGEEAAEIFAAHRMILTDPEYTAKAEELIRSGHVSAESAAEQAAESFAGVLEAMDNAYMSARAEDIREVCRRLVSRLEGKAGDDCLPEEPCIVAAENLSPGAIIQMDRSTLLGFVTEKGSVNSHAALLARTMGIPAIVGAKCALSEEWDGRYVILDGSEGVLYIDPDDETREQFRKKQEERRRERRLLETLKEQQNAAGCGGQIRVLANINRPEEAEQALENDADGIGLFRSEYLYLGRSAFPTEEEQYSAYRQALERMEGRQVIIRTVDIGADKRVPYFGLGDEENPALGLRAIRVCLTHPEILRTQLRALYRASAYGSLSILLPMIISAAEVRRVREIAAQVRDELREAGVAFREDVALGVMIETPAAAIISGELAKEADFFSVGTNDLTQYTLALDRENTALDAFRDPHHPAVLELIRMAAENAHREEKRIGICGELAADLSLTGTFLEMGIDSLSVPPAAVLPLRRRVLEYGLEDSGAAGQ